MVALSARIESTPFNNRAFAAIRESEIVEWRTSFCILCKCVRPRRKSGFYLVRFTACSENHQCADPISVSSVYLRTPTPQVFVKLTCNGRSHQWSITCKGLMIRICPSFHEKLDRFGTGTRRRIHQSCPATGINRIDVIPSCDGLF